MSNKKLKYKDIASILYMHYLNYFCENDYNFDNNETKELIESHYNKVIKNLTKKELNDIKSNITVYVKENTKYDSLEFRYTEMSDLVLLATPKTTYKEATMFFIDYVHYDFNDLN